MKEFYIIDYAYLIGIAYWEDFTKLKKFALHFKKDIGDYRQGENIVYDSLLDEFGKSFLNDLLEVLND